MIGDGYAMGVAAQILKHILRAAEGRWFRVHHPSPYGIGAVAKRREGPRVSQECRVPVKDELVITEGLSESRNQLTAEGDGDTWMERKNRSRDFIQCV